MDLKDPVAGIWFLSKSCNQPVTATSQLCQSRNHHCTLQGLESWPLLNWVQQNSQAMLSSVHELHGNLLDIRWACILIVEVLFSYPDHFPHGFLNQCFLFKALGLQIWCAVLKYVLFLLCGCNCSEHQHPFCKPETVPPLHLSFLFFFFPICLDSKISVRRNRLLGYTCGEMLSFHPSLPNIWTWGVL